MYRKTPIYLQEIDDFSKGSVRIDTKTEQYEIVILCSSRIT